MIWGRKQGEIRTYIWFAWYPVYLDDGRWVWWEKVKVKKINEFTERQEIKELKDEQKQLPSSFDRPL